MIFKSLFSLLITLPEIYGLIHNRTYYETKFFQWLTIFQEIQPKNYSHFSRLLDNFAVNDDIIDMHNSKHSETYKLGHNKFSHINNNDFKSLVQKGIKKDINDVTIPSVYVNISSLPLEIDWVSRGAVTNVKNQGQCGSCWTFSTTGAMEGAYQIKYGKLVSFSEQEFVDCDKTDSGCNGGLMDLAFTFAKRNGGICSEEDYPYVGKDGNCVKSCKNVPNSAPLSFTDVDNNENAMLLAVSKQPVSIAIQADQIAFQFYKSGVFTGNCGTDLDHGVLVVGYGTLDGVDYYKVKNSWGTSWGLDGYILLERNKEQEGGQCGYLLSASYPNY